MLNDCVVSTVDLLRIADIYPVNSTNKTPFVPRWLELIEKKICRLFRAYIKYRRFSDLQTEVMKDDENDGSNDMNRSMTLHRRIRNSMDFQHKKLHLEMR